MKRKIARTGKFFVYIVECRDKTYYTGYTNDLEKRLKEHNDGKRGAKYTRYKRPVKLVWKKEYKQFRPAVKVEGVIKGLTRLQKESLVGGRRLDKVLQLSKCKSNEKK